MTEKNCLNCHDEITGNYCKTCGQKSSTHRYSLKHFFEHDLVHGVWHVDKGILFTIKELFTRPGHSIREYILGKRVGYFNFVTLILIIIAMSGIIGHYSDIKLSDLMPEQSREAMGPIEKILSKYPKLVPLITIPLYSLFSFLWFRKAKFNYSEHLVLNSYKSAAELVIGLLFTTLTVFYTDKTVLFFLYYTVISISMLIYSVWIYYQFFSESGYSRRGRIIRSIMIPVSYIFLSIVFGIIWGIVSRFK